MTSQEDIGKIVNRARIAAQQRDWLEASRCWDAVRASSPEHVPAYLGAAQALRESGRYDDAELTLGAAAERFPCNEQIALARAWLSNQRRDWPAAVSRWEAVRAAFPDNLWGYVGSIGALRAAGRSDQLEPVLSKAETVLAAAKQRGADSATALRVGFEIARARLDWPGVRQYAESILAGGAAPSAQVVLALAQACWHLGDRDEADRFAVRAIAADPKLADAVLVRAWVATARGDGETALSCYRRLVQLNPGAVRWRLKLAQLLDWLGQVEESIGELETLRKQWPTNPVVLAYLQNHALESGDPADWPTVDGGPAATPSDYARHEIETVAAKAPGPAEQVRPLIVSDPRRDVLVAEAPEAEAAVLVFSGSRDEVSMPLALFDRYLATLNVTAIYLKDFNRLRYLVGLRSLGPDYQSALTALREMLTRLGVKRLCTIGNCIGGSAAIRYGVELGADRIIAFGPVTHHPHDSSANGGERLDLIEETRHFLRNRLVSNVPVELADIKPFLEARRHSTRIELFYGEEDPTRMQALRLSGLPGVTLHPQPEPRSDRLPRRFALSNPDFSGMLAELLGVSAPKPR